MKLPRKPQARRQQHRSAGVLACEFAGRLRPASRSGSCGETRLELAGEDACATRKNRWFASDVAASVATICVLAVFFLPQARAADVPPADPAIPIPVADAPVDVAIPVTKAIP